MAQLVGTEMGRGCYNQSIWLMRMELTIQARQPNYVLITDVRFDNEVRWILENKGHVIWLDRKEATGKVGIANHASEAGVRFELLEKMHRVENNGSIDDLAKSLKQIYELIKPKQLNIKGKFK